jgi:cyclopropane fatty-acyl-phospholipid synthase-like methyltransferase
MTERPFATSAERNAEPILEVLQTEFKNCTRVIEIGSGTGQHAARFATELTHLSWQTSDLQENHAGIEAWVEHAAVSRLLAPLALDVRDDKLADRHYDAAYSSNTAHIMGIDAVENMFTILGEALSARGVFCLYGPFREDGEFNSPSNAAFDASLRSRDSAMGIRDIEALDTIATASGMRRKRLYAMPANNHIAVWRKAAA